MFHYHNLNLTEGFKYESQGPPNCPKLMYGHVFLLTHFTKEPLCHTIVGL